MFSNYLLYTLWALSQVLSVSSISAFNEELYLIPKNMCVYLCFRLFFLVETKCWVGHLGFQWGGRGELAVSGWDPERRRHWERASLHSTLRNSTFEIVVCKWRARAAEGHFIFRRSRWVQAMADPSMQSFKWLWGLLFLKKREVGGERERREME